MLKRIVINFLLFISGIAVIYISFCMMGLLQLLQYKLIEINTNVGVLQFTLMIARFAISPLKNVLPIVLGITSIYHVTSWFLNLQMVYKSKHILSFGIYMILCLIFIIMIGLSPDPVLFLQFNFKESFLNCDINNYVELFNVEGLKDFINVLLSHLFEYIFHIVILLISIWSSFYAAKKLHDYYGYHY